MQLFPIYCLKKAKWFFMLPKADCSDYSKNSEGILEYFSIPKGLTNKVRKSWLK